MGSTEDAALSSPLLPLAMSQREVWLDQRAWPGSTHLNIGGGGYLVGPLDVTLLQQALWQLIDETEALRLVPLPEGGQRLLSHYRPPLELRELPDGPELRRAMRDWSQAQLSEPFELGSGPPWRFTLLRGRPDLHWISVQYHHTVMDGWGTTQVMRRWAELYSALIDGQPAPAADDAPYLQHIEDSTSYRASPAFQRDGAFWLEQLAELPAPVIARRHVQHQGGLAHAHLVQQLLPRSDYARFTAQAAGLGCTPFSCFLAALALYFWRSSGRDELLIGVPSLNRSGARFKRTPGMFVGLLALRLKIQPGMTGAQLLAHASHQMQAALRHSRYPLSELGHQLQLMRIGRDSVMDVLLSFERQDYALRYGQARLEDSRQVFAACARYPLAITICEFDPEGDLELALEASADCFAADESELLGRRLWSLAADLAAAPETALADYEVLPSEERWALVEGLHKDLAHLDAPPAFVQLFARQAALYPEATALLWDSDSGVQTLSYGQLARQAAALAAQLQRLGAGPESIVALALPRSAELIVALLGCAMTGAAFLPLDVEAPRTRLIDIIEDSGAIAVLYGEQSPPAAALLHRQSLAVPTLAPSALAAAAESGPQSWPEPPACHPEQLAYVLYTSGSSGRPKGVLMSHGSLSRRLAWLAKAWAIDSRDRAAQTTQLVFDPALIELLLPLSQGASIALPPPGRLHPERLADFILRHGVTFCALVPTTLAGFLAGLQGLHKGSGRRAEDGPAARRRDALKLRVVCSGGEVLPAELANRFLADTGAQLYNVYGPTEAAIFATAWPCVPTPGEQTLPVGRPVDDTRLYVLDERLRPQPFGVPGDIYIAGSTLARGYLGRPELDRQAFVPDPFQPGQRMYRSGDRGWLDCQGQLHFSGRADRQIKLRGYRIELGDVEAACLGVPGVRQAVVARIEPDGQARLHAWLAVRPELEAAHIQAALRDRLPDYMLPSSLSLLDALPQTSNGKIDMRALPAPSSGAPSEGRLEPANDLERELLKLWDEALSHRSERRAIRMQDNFFDLGGDSLAALSILAAMEPRVGRALPLQTISEHPTIASLAAALARPLALPGVLQRLSSGRRATPLYLAASGHGDVLRFKTLARALDGILDVQMLQPPHGESPAGIGDLAGLYADCIAAQDLAPGWVAGFSVGGVTALETACALQARGLPLRGLILLDTIYPEAVLGGSSSWRTLGWLVRKLHIQELSMNGRRLGAMFSDPGLIAQVMALRGYKSRGFDGPCLLVKSSGLAPWDRLLFKPWRRLMSGPFEEQVVSGLHGSIFEAAHVAALAQCLGGFVQRPPAPMATLPLQALRA
ncbi:amino acid adenylation domain-containing protein [Paucibacter sp. APW11]|uniref:Amino acid adenylation domain-containing protein n=1 Tax=Roseateles aquae TaxID=3077235 RepID=A0ABU3P8Q3_9BURK|nr:amino acid adenylation domain-containing protein [Paucibacter sp. APW11]MDT8998677.1 amino acid adenylation domain-containing protein [Paucibacter sp. APW11]